MFQKNHTTIILVILIYNQSSAEKYGHITSLYYILLSHYILYDNRPCVDWCKGTMTKNSRIIQRITSFAKSFKKSFSLLLLCNRSDSRNIQLGWHFTTADSKDSLHFTASHHRSHDLQSSLRHFQIFTRLFTFLRRLYIRTFVHTRE